MEFVVSCLNKLVWCMWPVLLFFFNFPTLAETRCIYITGGRLGQGILGDGHQWAGRGCSNKDPPPFPQNPALKLRLQKVLEQQGVYQINRARINDRYKFLEAGIIAVAFANIASQFPIMVVCKVFNYFK